MATVNTDLRSLVFGKSQGQDLFSFGALADKEPNRDLNEASGEVHAVSEPRPETEAADLFQDLNTAKFFFPMLDTDKVSSRSLFQDVEPFARKDSMEQIQAKWKERQAELTLDYKKKHKTAFKRNRKVAKK
ncbi:hypothetical protein HDV03_003456 [Kappamyces sp. JEL0829]|nr:hypothetical protein HDV03_003456 [Kappamyces sp. JEL0829]KAJ3368958.1 hypothetical protein HDU91_000178 [Kappamyces sp. JEL0680]